MLKIREIKCKSILNKSSLSKFSLNCYVGCVHRCVYCYASYMKKFKNNPEPWGKFVDVKINAAKILASQLKKFKRPVEVFMSSICDGWQPLEAKYQLSRKCLGLLLETGFSVSILTKSSLIQRDFDILRVHKTSSLGVTITTVNSNLQEILEPYASSVQDRLNVLKWAQNLGIKTWVFLGPLIPEFTDTRSNLEMLFRALKGLNLTKIYVDRLNLRWGVLDNLRGGLIKYDPISFRQLVYKTTHPVKYLEYSLNLKRSSYKLACQLNLSDRLTFCF